MCDVLYTSGIRVVRLVDSTIGVEGKAVVCDDGVEALETIPEPPTSIDASRIQYTL